MLQAVAEGGAVAGRSERGASDGARVLSRKGAGPDGARGVRPASEGSLLLVDPDSFLIEMLASGLALSRPRWEVVATRHPAEALEVLNRRSQFNVIISEVEFPPAPDLGKAFIREASRRWPDIPIFVMTQAPAEETHELDAAEYIAKPPDMDFLLSRVERVVRHRKQSLVRGFSLMTFLQILELEKKTCTLIVSHGGYVGEVYFRHGILLQARFDGLEGPEALFRMLSMRDHNLRVIDQCDAERQITASLSGLLMEWSVREDHKRRGETQSREEDR